MPAAGIAAVAYGALLISIGALAFGRKRVLTAGAPRDGHMS
jgi:hypothetical protein